MSEDELNRELEAIAARQRQSVAALKARLTKEGALDSIEGQIRSRKALDLVIDSAETRTEDVDGSGEAEGAAGESGPGVG